MQMFASTTTFVLLSLLSIITNGVNAQADLVSLPAGLGRGVNFGNMLDGWQEGANGYPVQEEFFDVVKRVGMSHIRLPVSFTYHAEAAAPYTLNADFMARLDDIIDMAIDTHGIKVILDQHHYDGIQLDPVGEEPRALAIWDQLATRYADRDEAFLYFEIQNEPHGAFNDDPSLLNGYLKAALEIIRLTNPNRKVLVGPNQWNGVGGLEDLELPDDPNLILTMHYYSPGDFTHQGAEWIDNAAPAGTVEWKPNNMGLWWWDYSWGVEKKVTRNKGLRVKYTSAWAMLSFHQPGGIENTAKVVITTNTTTDLKLGLKLSNGKNADGSWNFVYRTTFNTGVGVTPFEFDVPPETGVFSEMHLQNLSEESQRRFFLNDYHLELADGTKIPTFVSAAEQIYLDLAQMVRWGNRHNLPVHLGEFGAYHLAPTKSRKKWTKAVREAAEQLGMDWSYWELVAGFGFWDVDAHTWKDRGLKNALVRD